MKKERREKAMLTISGDEKYVERLAAHLRKEHPSTRHRMRVKG